MIQVELIDSNFLQEIVDSFETGQRVAESMEEEYLYRDARAELDRRLQESFDGQ
jgi:hypothetical protein